MSRIEGNTYYAEPEQPQQCDECGEIEELRPYGNNGACICIECSHIDQEQTNKNIAKFFRKNKIKYVEHMGQRVKLDLTKLIEFIDN